MTDDTRIQVGGTQPRRPRFEHTFVAIYAKGTEVDPTQLSPDTEYQVKVSLQETRGMPGRVGARWEYNHDRHGWHWIGTFGEVTCSAADAHELILDFDPWTEHELALAFWIHGAEMLHMPTGGVARREVKDGDHVRLRLESFDIDEWISVAEITLRKPGHPYREAPR